MNRFALIGLTLGLLIVLGGFYVGFSESTTSYFNTITGQFQDSGNPATVQKTIYPNSWLGTVISIVGVLVALLGVVFSGLRESKVQT